MKFFIFALLFLTSVSCIASPCDRSLQTLNHQNINYNEVSAQQDMKLLLEKARRGIIDRDSSSLGVYSNELNARSWMLPFEEASTIKPKWMPEEPGSLHPLTLTEFQSNLEFLESLVENPDHGLFGPHSLFWRVAGIIGDGHTGGAMNSLQLAHHPGAQGVLDHSQLLSNYTVRMRRTAQAIFGIIYGPWPQAKKTFEGVFRGHRHVTGTLQSSLGPYHAGDAYAALEPESLMWVWATRVMAWIEAYDVLTDDPLSDVEREVFYQESKLFGLGFGIPASLLPRTFEDFYYYYHYVIQSDRLGVGQPARTIVNHFNKLGDNMTARIIQSIPGGILGKLLLGPSIALSSHIQRSGMENMTAYYMPRSLTQAYGFRNSPTEAALTAKLSKGLWNELYSHGLHYLPHYLIAMARVQGKQPPASAVALERLLFAP